MSNPIDIDDAEVWRDVAIALASDIADLGADPRSHAVIAYNHARNGRMNEAAHAITPKDGPW